MKGQGPSQKLDDDSLLTFKITSPFALQSIFLTLSIPEHPPFTGNNPFPGDFHAPVEGGEFETKKGNPKAAGPIRS